MSKNIVIAEGRRGRRFGAVKKLRTKLQGGGDCLWVPEDDVQLESLYAYENGVYWPEAYGFDRASVSVIDASLAPLSTGHNTPSFPPAGTDGFSQVTVNVPASEQDTYMDAIQWQCIPMPSDKPYLWIIFADLHDGNDHTKVQTIFQSAFPPFVNYIDGVPALCGFIRGENSLRVTYNWENWNKRSTPTYINHAWLRNNIIDYNDGFSGNTGAIGSSGMGSRLYNGEDILDFRNGVPAYVTEVVSEGDHFAGAVSKSGYTSFFKQTSTLNLSEGGKMNSARHVIAINNRTTNGFYTYDYWTTACDYRIIHGKAFSDMEEWLTWCKTH